MAQVQSKKVQKSAEERAAVRKDAAATEWSSGKKGTSAPQSQGQAQARSNSDDYIVPRGNHPAEAVYVARDKKSGAEVSFDSWGRKLDSLGHVVAGDRQRAGDAGAKIIYRPEPEQPKGPPPQPKNGYEIGAGISPARGRLTSLLSPGSGAGARRSSWDNSVMPDTAPRSAPPGVLLPGGIDPATGEKVPTAFNGMLPRAQSAQPQASQAAPQMGPQIGPQTAPWRSGWQEGLEDFVAGNNPYSPVQPKVNIPGFGQLPQSVVPTNEPPQQGYGFPEFNPIADVPNYRRRVYEPYQNAYMPVTDPLAVYR
jgi:hypothetical protein